VTNAALIRASQFRWPGGRRDPRWVMIGIHSSFTVLGQTVLHFAITPAQLVTALAVCCGWDASFHRALYGRWIVPKSGIITALGLGLLLRGPGLYPYAFAGTLAILSKHLIKVNGKHVFNPSTFGIVATFLLISGTHTSFDQWGRSAWIAFLILNLGMFVIYRVRRFDVVISFAAAFFVFNGIHELASGYSLNTYAFWATWHTSAAPAALIFTFFMITDPRTSPSTRLGRVAYCVATAALAVKLNAAGQPGLFFGLFVVLMTVPLLDALLVGRSLRLLPRRRLGTAVG
jgi:enediyne biosynthesis protein E5